MSVYFIQAGQGGPIKIGFAADVGRRLVKMQADNHEQLAVLADIDGDRVAERRFHKRFVAHHRHGEWFEPASEILDFVDSLGPQERLAGNLSDRVRRIHDLRQQDSLSYAEVIEALGGSIRVAESLSRLRARKVTAGAVSKWHWDNWAPWWSHHFLARLAVDADLPRCPDEIQGWVSVILGKPIGDFKAPVTGGRRAERERARNVAADRGA